MPVTRPATALERIEKLTERLADHNSSKVPMDTSAHKALLAELWWLNHEVRRHFSRPSQNKQGMVRDVLLVALVVSGLIAVITGTVVGGLMAMQYLADFLR